MSRVSKKILNKQIEEQIFETLWEAISQVKNKNDVRLFVNDLLTPIERIMVTKRLAIAVLLLRKYNYETIIDLLKVSNETISRIALILKTNSGYKIAVNKIIRSEAGRKFWQDVENTLYRLSAPGRVFLKKKTLV